jgi:DNA repair photolyase
MAAKGLVGVGISMTTLSSQLSRQMEPRAPAPARRLKMIARLSEAGIPTRVMLAPVIPALTDHEIEAILKAGALAGARSAEMIMLRLPREVAPLFIEWLERVMPDRAARIMGRVRELHGGRDYDPEFGKRMRGEGAFAELAAQRFDLACRKLRLTRDIRALRCDLFAVPPRAGDQLSLF